MVAVEDPASALPSCESGPRSIFQFPYFVLAFGRHSLRFMRSLSSEPKSPCFWISLMLPLVVTIRIWKESDVGPQVLLILTGIR